jgi:hypothetical protein
MRSNNWVYIPLFIASIIGAITSLDSNFFIVFVSLGILSAICFVLDNKNGKNKRLNNGSKL